MRCARFVEEYRFDAVLRCGRWCTKAAKTAYFCQCGARALSTVNVAPLNGLQLRAALGKLTCEKEFSRGLAPRARAPVVDVALAGSSARMGSQQSSGVTALQGNPVSQLLLTLMEGELR